MKNNQLEIVIWLQQWYLQYCDGDWEHSERINIHTIDNPGWRVTISLEGTHCENAFFKNIETENNENDWFHCFLRNGNFEGAGGACNLLDILYVFKDWVEQCQTKRSI